MVADAGGITTILSALICHESNANLQYHGCVTLQSLAVNDNNKMTIAEARGITWILSAMKNHSSNVDMQYYGCAVLQNLAVNNDKNWVMIPEAGGITMILSAMKSHSSNTDVQYYGCAAIQELCCMVHSIPYIHQTILIAIINQNFIAMLIIFTSTTNVDTK